MAFLVLLFGVMQNDDCVEAPCGDKVAKQAREGHSGNLIIDGDAVDFSKRGNKVDDERQPGYGRPRVQAFEC